MRALAVVLAVFALESCGGSGVDPRPDVLLVSLDTVRADRLSCYGNDAETTPFLDRMAALGVRFEHAYASAPHTAPSHMSLFTGLDPLAHGVPNKSAGRDRLHVLNEGVATLPQAIADAGYRTIAVTDRGQLDPAMGFYRGFDAAVPKYSKFGAKLDAVDELLADLPDGDEPLFAFFHSYECHAPYLPPLAVMRRFCDTDYRGVFRQRYDELRRDPAGFLTLKAGQFLADDPAIGDVDVAWLLSLYDANLAYADGQLAELWKRWGAVREHGNTVLAVLSDHGEGFGEHGFLGHPPRLERELLHVPLIVKGPGIGVGVTRQPVPLSGLFASLMELVGGAAPADAEPSFAALLRDPAAGVEPRELHQQLVGFSGAKRSDAVAVGDRRLLLAGDRELLFAFPDDPLEQAPLVLEPELVEGLRAALLERRRIALDLRGRYPSELVEGGGDRREELEALGYVEGADD